MKAFISFVLLTLAAAEKAYDTECPPEQADDWTIEKLLRHEDCDKFYKCTYGKPVEMLCPANLWFNLESWQCDYPHNVDCSGRNEPTLAPPPATNTTPASIPDTTSTPSSTTITTSTPQPPLTIPTTTSSPTTTSTDATTPDTTWTETEFTENGCPVNPHIHWLLPHETDCNLFYYCVWGEKVLQQCSSTLHFNKVKQVCDFPYRAGCNTSFDKNARRRREILLDL